jgi:undecaprenyl diphosphate synthase
MRTQSWFINAMTSFRDQINPESIPLHIAIIMDGNGRWAKKQGQFRLFGHKKGTDSVRRTVEAAGELGVKYLTLYAFSKENWNRAPEEVSGLMSLLISTLNIETRNLLKNNVKLHAIGDLENLPKIVRKKLEEGIKATSSCTGLNLILALSYGSRWEITQAVQSIALKVKSGLISPDTIDENVIINHLTTSNIPDPELLIRTSGEYRISNFLLWQIAYSELYFSEKYWPEFEKDDLYKAILDYQKRERRFGKTSEQIQEKTISI